MILDIDIARKNKYKKVTSEERRKVAILTNPAWEFKE